MKKTHDKPSDGWLIYKTGRGFYRPGAQGYTQSAMQAGRFSYADALAHSQPNGPDGPRDGITMMHETDVAKSIARDARWSAIVLLEWIDGQFDPTAVALAIAQADEALVKAADASGGDLDAAKLAFARRFVESIALGNADLIRALTPEARNAV